MAGVADERLKALRAKAHARHAAQKQAAGDAPTPGHTPREVAGDDAEAVYTPRQVAVRLPEPRKAMKRTQHFLREDQIERLDELVRRHPGTTRSDFLREAVDLYLSLIEEGEA